MDLKDFIRDIPDFPKTGIHFKDVTPLLEDAAAFNRASSSLLGVVETKIDKVVGIESRGFFFAPLLALNLNAGFVPVRKQGKLPSDILAYTYALEYGTDVLEIHVDAIQKGDRVLVHDDVLATGGTAHAVCKLVEQLGGKVVQCNFLIELGNLQGRRKLADFDVKSLIHY